MFKSLFLSLLALSTVLPLLPAQTLPLKNPGFEEGLEGWVLLEKDPNAIMSSVSTEAAHEGSQGLRVEDRDPELGSSLVSQPVPAQAGKTYQLSFYAFAQGGNKGGVFLRFLDAGKKVLNGQNLPSVAIDQSGEWHQFALEATAPPDTAGVAVWVHTWSGAQGIIDFDDFAIEEVEGSSTSAPAPDAPAAAPTPKKQAAATPRQKPAMVVIKVDDLKVGKNGKIHPAWERFLEILKARQIKGSIGLICETLEGASPEEVRWIKEAQETGLVEFWFHGYDHGVREENGIRRGEFVGRPYDDQKRRFEQSISLAQEKLGLTLQTFGPPGGGKDGSFDESTVQVMQDVPEMKVWLYPQPLDEAGRALLAKEKVKILDRVWQVNIEQPLFIPNAQKAIDGYKKYPGRAYFVIQGHPTHWKDEGFTEFEKLLDFFTAEGATFVTPMECAQAAPKAE